MQIGHTQDSIPVIYNVTAIHDLSENVFKIIPWNLPGTGVALHVVVQDNGRVSQVTSIESIFHVPALWSELSSLEHDRVEIAECEQNGLDLGILVLDLLFRKLRERSLNILFDSLWWLVGELDGSFKETNWNIIARVR